MKNSQNTGEEELENSPDQTNRNMMNWKKKKELKPNYVKIKAKLFKNLKSILDQKEKY